MLDDIPQLDEVDLVLDDLTTPTSLEVYEAMLPYNNDMVAAASAQRALNGGGGGGGSPTGAAGGVLGGTYPNPSFAADMATQAELDAHVNDTSAAHAASAVSADSTTLVGTGTTVQAVLEELDDAVAASQPLDSDLTAIAALTTTSFGRALLELANQAALLAAAGAAAAVHAHSGADITSGTVVDARIDAAIARDSEVAAAYIAKTLADANSVLYAVSDDTPAALAMGASTILARLASGNIVAATPSQLRTLLTLVPGTDVQAYDSDLASIAALSTTTFGRSLLALADAAALLAAAGAAASSHAHSGADITSGTVADARIDAAIARDSEVTAAIAAAYPLLAAVKYDPSTYTLKSLNSATLTALDTTNLRVVFTAPASGKVVVRLSAMISAAGTVAGYFGLLSGASTVAVSTAAFFSGAVATEFRVSVPIYVTGLTPGNVYTWDWAYKTNASGNNFKLSYGDSGALNPALIEVWAA